MATSPAPQEKCVSLRQFSEAVEAIKGLHMFIVSLMTDISALRRTTLNDSDLISEYCRYLRAASKEARPFLQEAMDCYDQLLEPDGDKTEYRN